MKAKLTCKIAISLVCVAASFAATGCTIFSEPQRPIAKSLPPGTPTYTVVFRVEGSKPKAVKLPLADTTYLNDALKQAGAANVFSTMKVQIVRKVPGQLQPLKLRAAWDKKAGRVSAESDYAVHPDDHIVVMDDSVGMLDQMLGTITAPLGDLPMMH